VELGGQFARIGADRSTGKMPPARRIRTGRNLLTGATESFLDLFGRPCVGRIIPRSYAAWQTFREPTERRSADSRGIGGGQAYE
jgi:hypothetical protein